MASIRPMKIGDIEQVLLWRNHPNIRRFMFTQHEISLDEHTQWFIRESQDPEKHLLIFEINSCPLGFIRIHKIAIGGIADWGFYVAPDSIKGTGRALGQAALRYAFQTLGVTKLCGKVLSFNEHSNRFHKNLGFQREGILRKQFFDGQLYHDVICFGLLAKEWYQAN